MKKIVLSTQFVNYQFSGYQFEHYFVYFIFKIDLKVYQITLAVPKQTTGRDNELLVIYDTEKRIICKIGKEISMTRETGRWTWDWVQRVLGEYIVE